LTVSDPLTARHMTSAHALSVIVCTHTSGAGRHYAPAQSSAAFWSPLLATCAAD
jgi:hypothetical protein